jgi:hypothetical protein
MSKFNIGDKVFHFTDGEIFKGTGVGKVIGIEGDKKQYVRIEWSNKKRYSSSCKDPQEHTILLDPARVLKIGDVEVYLNTELSADDMIEDVFKQLAEM